MFSSGWQCSSPLGAEVMNNTVTDADLLGKFGYIDDEVACCSVLLLGSIAMTTMFLTACIGR